MMQMNSISCIKEPTRTFYEDGCHVLKSQAQFFYLPVWASMSQQKESGVTDHGGTQGRLRRGSYLGPFEATHKKNGSHQEDLFSLRFSKVHGHNLHEGCGTPSVRSGDGAVGLSRGLSHFLSTPADDARIT